MDETFVFNLLELSGHRAQCTRSVREKDRELKGPRERKQMKKGTNLTKSFENEADGCWIARV